MPFKISTYKYCKSVKIICIILYYLWNFENKYSVCLSVIHMRHMIIINFQSITYNSYLHLWLSDISPIIRDHLYKYIASDANFTVSVARPPNTTNYALTIKISHFPDYSPWLLWSTFSKIIIWHPGVILQRFRPTGYLVK